MMEKEHKHLGAFLSGIIKENPLLVGLLGFCPALAVTTSLESAFGMGVLFTVVLTCSNLIVSLLRKIIPEEVRTPCYIVVIATFVTIVKMLCEAFLPELYSSLAPTRSRSRSTTARPRPGPTAPRRSRPSSSPTPCAASPSSARCSAPGS